MAVGIPQSSKAEALLQRLRRHLESNTIRRPVRRERFGRFTLSATSASCIAEPEGPVADATPGTGPSPTATAAPRNSCEGLARVSDEPLLPLAPMSLPR